MEGHPEVGGKRGRKKNSMLKKNIFRNVAVVTFQSVFHLEIH